MYNTCRCDNLPVKCTTIREIDVSKHYCQKKCLKCTQL
jgi:hypothetical protein